MTLVAVRDMPWSFKAQTCTWHMRKFCHLGRDFRKQRSFSTLRLKSDAMLQAGHVNRKKINLTGSRYPLTTGTGVTSSLSRQHVVDKWGEVWTGACGPR